MNYTGPVLLGYECFAVIWNNSGHKSKFSVHAPDVQLTKVKIEWIATGPPSVTILLTLNHDHISFTHRSDPIALDSSYMTHLLRSQSA